MQTESSYEAVTAWLFQQFPAYFKIGEKAFKPTLDNTRKLIDFYRVDLSQLRFIHVAGTNGKGSVCNYLASILAESGERTGLFTSPHLKDYRERIRVNGTMISEAEVIAFCEPLQKPNALDFQPSFFEISWVMALDHFIRQKCTVCVIETGLGGRLDATNVITPMLSIITNISLEHTQILGNTVEQIAVEKAGIIKKGIPVLIGERDPKTVPVFERTAEERSAVLSFADRCEAFPDLFQGYFELPYQRRNFQTVFAASQILRQQGFDLSEEDLLNGVTNIRRNTGFAGRFQVVSTTPRIFLDVSHNEAGIRETLGHFTRDERLTVVYGGSSDKDLDAIFGLFPKTFRYFFTTFPGGRSAGLEDLERLGSKYDLNANYFTDPQKALLEAKETVNKEDTILIFGSFFLVSCYF